MRNTIRFAIGIFATLNVIYKLAKCPSCDESILGFAVSGQVYITISLFFPAVILYVAYMEFQVNKQA